MSAVLLLFLIPVGGGIPAGVLLARTRGLHWGVTAGLYLLSDLILALAVEPVLRLLVAGSRRLPFLARLGAAMRLAMGRAAAPWRGTGAGPLALVLVSFGVDPVTGRAAALAAGHGAAAGWALALAGDLLYYGTVALATLQLNAWLRSPGQTVTLVLAAMVLVPMAVQRLRGAGRHPGPGR